MLNMPFSSIALTPRISNKYIVSRQASSSPLHTRYRINPDLSFRMTWWSLERCLISIETITKLDCLHKRHAVLTDLYRRDTLVLSCGWHFPSSLCQPGAAHQPSIQTNPHTFPKNQRPRTRYRIPATMLRRPPTIVSLTEDDLHFHLQRIFARSLPVNIDQLSLAETDQNYAEQEDPHPTNTTSEEQQPSNPNSTGRLDQHCPLHGSTSGPSCMTLSLSTAARTHPATLPASINGSTHPTIVVDPTRAPIPAATTAQLISSNLPQTRASRLREPSPSHPRTESTIPPQEFWNRHILPSPDGKKGLTSAAPGKINFRA